MRKSLERCNKAIRRLKGNEGFSLVELIIVIAIMVALVAILAPQYFQYIEKSRKSVDITTADEILSATEVAAIDPFLKIDGDFLVTWYTEGTSATGELEVTSSDLDSDTVDAILDALCTTLGIARTTTGTPPVTSDPIIDAKSQYSTHADFTVTVDFTDNAGFTFATPTGWLDGSGT